MPKLKNWPPHIEIGDSIYTFTHSVTVRPYQAMPWAGGNYFGDGEHIIVSKEEALNNRVPESQIPDDFIEG